MSSVINGDEGDAIGWEDDDGVGVWILEWEELCFVVDEVDSFDGVAGGCIDDVFTEETVAGGVGRL